MRCDGAGPDSTSPQPVTARASSLRTAISQRDRNRCHRWPRRSSLRDDDRPGGFSRPGGRARGGCRASGPIRKFTRAFAARTRGRVDVTASGCDPRRQRGLRPARCRRRGQGQYLGACARWRGRRSRCSSAPPSHCAWPPWTACPSCPLPHASRRARGLRHAYSPRVEKATLQHPVHARWSWHGGGCASPSRLCQLSVADAGLVWEGLLQVMAIEE